MSNTSVVRSGPLRSILWALAGAVVGASCWSGASAQSVPLAETDLPQILTDQNGVELTTGQLGIQLPLISFGDGIALNTHMGWTFPGSYDKSGGFVGLVSASADVFAKGDGEEGYEYHSWTTPSGKTLWNHFATPFSTGTGYYYKRPAGGTFNVPYYTSPNADIGPQASGFVGHVDGEGNTLTLESTGSIPTYRFVYTFANGEQWRALLETSSLVPCTQYSQYCVRERSVTSSRGYFIQYEYQREAAPTTQSQVAAWLTITRMSGASLAHVYCDTASTAICQNALNEGNSVTFDYSDGLTVTHASGTVAKYRINGSGALEVSSPGTNASLTATRLYSSCGSAGSIDFVNQVTSAGATWTYDYQCFEGEQTNYWYLNRTNPQGGVLHVDGYTRDVVPSMYQDEMLKIHGFGGDLDLGYTAYLPPGGGGPFISRDQRNNVVGAGRWASDYQTSLMTYNAEYPAVCSNFKTCNHPTWTRDGNNNQTDYTYDPQHGGVLTMIGPPAANGIRPQMRYEYEQRYPWLKNSSGSYSQGATAIWVRTKEEHCISTAATGGNCTGGTADEVVTTFDYGPTSAPNNLLLRGVVVTADGQSLRTCFSYDRMGRKISETQPNANLASCP